MNNMGWILRTALKKKKKKNSRLRFTTEFIDRVQSSIDKSRPKAKIEREKALGTRLGVSRIPNAYAGSNWMQ